MAVPPCSRLRQEMCPKSRKCTPCCFLAHQCQQQQQQRCRKLQSLARQRHLLIAEFSLQVLGAGKTDGAMDAANLLKPMLARGELRCIGATTLAEYRQHMEKDAAFERRFQQACPSVKPLSA